MCQIEDWDSVLNVNLHGVVNGVQAAYPVMLSQGYGHIVNTASMAGLLPMPTAVSYAATKHAVVGLSKSLRVEAASYWCPCQRALSWVYSNAYPARREIR